jgi:hypothetical protein
MWIMTNTGFVSIVRKGCTAGQLLVRARRREDLVALLGKDCEITENAGTDYQVRTCISEDRLADIISAAVRAIDYSNFKSSVADDDLHDRYLDVWHDMAKLRR